MATAQEPSTEPGTTTTPAVGLREQWRRTMLVVVALVLVIVAVAVLAVIALDRTWHDVVEVPAAQQPDDIQQAETTTYVALAAIIVIAVAAIGAVLIVGRRWVDQMVKPIEQLSETLRKFSDGDFSERARLRRRSDELGDLASRFNAMADLVAASHNEVAFEVYHDALTGLVNRAGIVRRLDMALDHVPPGIGGPHILVIDLDDFERVNRQLGDDDADEVLRIVGNRLLACTRPSDVAARLEGDTFAIVLDSPSDADVAQQVADRVLRVFSQQLRIASHDIDISASIGIAGYTSATADAQQLLRHATAAMEAAKVAGKKRWEIYTSQHDQLLPPSNAT